MNNIVIYDDIPGISTPWENYAGSSVEQYIKDVFKGKVGWVYRRPSSINDISYLYGFSDYDTFLRWFNGSTADSPLFIIPLPYDEVFELTMNFSTNTPVVTYTDQSAVNAGLLFNVTVRNKNTGVVKYTDHSATVIVKRNDMYLTTFRIDPSTNYQNIDLSQYVNVSADIPVNSFNFVAIDEVSGIVSSPVSVIVQMNVGEFIVDVTDFTVPMNAYDDYTLKFMIGGTYNNKDLQISVKKADRYTPLWFSRNIGSAVYIDPPYTLNGGDVPFSILMYGNMSWYGYGTERTGWFHKVSTCFVGYISDRCLMRNLEYYSLTYNMPSPVHLCELMHCQSHNADIGVKVIAYNESSRTNPYHTEKWNRIMEEYGPSYSDYDLWSCVDRGVYPGYLGDMGYPIDSALQSWKHVKDYTNWRNDWDDGDVILGDVRINNAEPNKEHSVYCMLQTDNMMWFDGGVVIPGYYENGEFIPGLEWNLTLNRYSGT